VLNVAFFWGKGGGLSKGVIHRPEVEASQDDKVINQNTYQMILLLAHGQLLITLSASASFGRK